MHKVLNTLWWKRACLLAGLYLQDYPIEYFGLKTDTDSYNTDTNVFMLCDYDILTFRQHFKHNGVSIRSIHVQCWYTKVNK